MSFRTWLLESRLRRIDGRLRQLRAYQKRLREEEAELVKAKKAGLDPAEVTSREEKLHHEREALTEKVGALMAREEATKQELRELGVTLTSH